MGSLKIWGTSQEWTFGHWLKPPEVQRPLRLCLWIEGPEHDGRGLNLWLYRVWLKLVLASRCWCFGQMWNKVTVFASLDFPEFLRTECWAFDPGALPLASLQSLDRPSAAVAQIDTACSSSLSALHAALRLLACSQCFFGIAWGMEYLSSGYAQRNLLVLLSQGSTAGRGIRLKGTWFCHCKDLRICMVLWPAYC